MDQQQSIDLFLKGKIAWNKWAERLLRRKKKLVESGRWQVTTNFDFEKGYFATEGHNKESREWLRRAMDFRSDWVLGFESWQGQFFFFTFFFF